MCGIFGIVSHTSTALPDAGSLQSSATLLNHRGPDAEGLYRAEGVGLAHKRLSLVDLNPRSNQPFSDPSGRYYLVYNGEIYNFRELRDELAERHGVEFNTTSDTEVLLYALIHYGADAILPRLEGMFAFGFYDAQEKSLLLARDRFGMKPLYIYEDDSSFLFSSEIKAFRPWITAELDQFSISSYLLGFGGPTRGCTFYRKIRSITPGSLVRVKPKQAAVIEPFFVMTDFCDEAAIDTLNSLKPEQMVDRMEELLYRSVEKHMFADSPVGAFCSGGVDSSLLMAMAAKMHNNLAIFHSNVKGTWSEHHAAVELSKHLKLDLKTVDVTDQDFVDQIPNVMEHYEHPFTYHPNCAPFLMVSRLVEQHGVKGMLSGEGSDECFLGYPWLGRKRLVDAYYRFGNRLKNLVHRIPNVGRIIWPEENSSSSLVRDLMNRCEIREETQRTRRVAAQFPAGKISEGNTWTLDYLNYHLRTLLHRNDCMGMAASIEARFPFLDHEVVKTAVNMPYRYKIRFSPAVLEKAHPGIRDKWVVRKVADRYIPRSLSQRIKIGFWTTSFQRMQLDPAYFNQSYVRDLFELTGDQMADIIKNADQDLTMRLLHLDVWQHVCVHDQPKDASLAKLRDHISIRPE